MVSRRSIDIEYVPGSDREFAREAARVVRLAVRDRGAGPATAERELRRTYPYAAVVAAPLSVGPGAAATADIGWRIYRDGGESQASW